MKKRKRKKNLPSRMENETRFLLEGLAEQLDAHVRGTSMSTVTASGYIGDNRRILNPPQANLTAAQRRQFAAAYAYLLRLELYGPGEWKRARGDTADAHEMADTSVSKYTTIWGKDAKKRLEKTVSRNIKFGLRLFPGRKIPGRRQRILQAELQDLEHDYPEL